MLSTVLAVCNCDQICLGPFATLLATEVRTNVRDNSCNFGRDVVTGNGDVVHDGRIYPHPHSVSGGVDLDTVSTGSPDHMTLRRRWLASEKEGINRGLPAFQL